MNQRDPNEFVGVWAVLLFFGVALVLGSSLYLLACSAGGVP